MNDKNNSGRIGNIKRDFRQFWTDLVAYYKLPFGWQAKTWRYVAAGIILFPGLFFVDPFVRVLFAGIHTPFLDGVFSFAHWYGKIHLTLDSFIILYLIGLVISHDALRRAGWKIFEGFAISGITVTIFKSIFGRWRPYTGHGSFAFVGPTFGPNGHLSLPSGDVGVAVAYSMILAGFSENKVWKAVWYLFALLTVFGRIYHDQHWFSDVLLAAIISISVGNFINHSRSQEEAPLESHD
ncbi:MAG: phosphatase PAP2 family protein [Bacteroidetes bacterium]|nr:phosphatase PAP2 family protein [Bacteroidota bacterium]